MLSLANTSNRIGCLTTGMGSTIHGCQHRRALVSGRSNPSYQLSRVTGGLSGPQNLCKQPEGPDSSESGQHLSSNVHKSERRHTLNTIIQPSLGNVGVVSPETTNYSSRTSSRPPQLGCRLRVQNDEGSMRLDDTTKSVSANTTVPRPTTNRPVSISPNEAVNLLLQLETGPESRGYRCLYSELGTGKGVCQSPMVSDTLVPQSNKTIKCQSIASDTILAIPALVPTCS